MAKKKTSAQLNREIARALAAGNAKAAVALANRIAELGLTRQVRSEYDRAQNNAVERDDYMAMEKAGDMEAAQWVAHNHAIDAVWMFLADRLLVTQETPIEVVGEAFSLIS